MYSPVRRAQCRVFVGTPLISVVRSAWTESKARCFPAYPVNAISSLTRVPLQNYPYVDVYVSFPTCPPLADQVLS